jgi:Na+-driven multidrug efflux pump
MYSEVCCVWGIGVPLAFLGALYLRLPVYMVVLLVQAEEFTKLFITIKRFRSKKWVKNLVRDIH